MNLPSNTQEGARERAFDFLVIGGGAAGLSCAETIRRRNSEASLAILSKDAELPYSRVLLPAYVKGEIAREEVFLRTRDHYVEKGIELILGTEVQELNHEAKWVVAGTGEKIHFGTLCIATGGNPRQLSASDEGIKIFQLHTLADADALRAMCAGPLRGRWIIIGGGYIGLEFANIAQHYGVEATLLTPHTQLFAGMLTPEGATIVADALTGMGMTITYNARAERIQQDENGYSVETPQGVFTGQQVCAGIGIERVQSWFGAPNKTGGIMTDDTFRAGNGDVYAAGDVAVRTNALGEEILSGTWASAVQMGMVAGTNMTGGSLALSVPTIYSITVGSVHISCIGDVHTEGAVTVVRTVRDASRIEFCFREGVLVGVALLNTQSELGQCIRLLAARATLGEREALFVDVAVPLASL